MSGNSLYGTPAELRVAKCQLHGVLVQVYGSGVLLIGESGVGKTAAAMQLLRRGHVFVADDAVQIFYRGNHFFGGAPQITRSLVHVRGVGISKVADLNHQTVLSDECRIDLCVEIYDRTDAPATTVAIREMLEDRISFFRINSGSPPLVADRIETIVREFAAPIVS